MHTMSMFWNNEDMAVTENASIKFLSAVLCKLQAIYESSDINMLYVKTSLLHMYWQANDHFPITSYMLYSIDGQIWCQNSSLKSQIFINQILHEVPNRCSLKPKFHYADFHQNVSLGKIADTNPESRGCKPSWPVEMAAMKSMTSPRQTNLCHCNGI